MNTDLCFNLALRKSSRLITQFYEERLSEAGLKVGQFSILRAVYFSKQTTNKELQAILVLDQTTLSRNLKPLLRDKFLQQQQAPEDARLKLISLTASGKKLYAQADPIWRDAQKQLLKKIGSEDASNILRVADALAHALGEG
ncbi:MarR family winged helix-turn-helix transcriptional regulator [Agaribacterium sp. ZY112]|uniref:MarR family winged helix-turn-helix transcriptional regulator n=1 Tax=Agaribacterium sp. ZY112 TaxID=3233574 RepID=UPI003524DBA6